MDFTLSSAASTWSAGARLVGTRVTPATTPADVVAIAADAGLHAADADLMLATVAVEELAHASAPASLVLALHLGVALATPASARSGLLATASVYGMALSTDQVPRLEDGRLWGRATWVAPVGSRASVVVGAVEGDALVACAVSLGQLGVSVARVPTAGLEGCPCGHVTFEASPCERLGPPLPFMARARILLAAVGLGVGRRALSEALDSARGLRGRGAGGEQTVQGLLADAATELDAARLLTWKAASADVVSLADASMAKLAATEAAQAAVARATQVLGVMSFQDGHILARLSQDVRALELFAGRTEALREAVAGEYLPQAPTR